MAAKKKTTKAKSSKTRKSKAKSSQAGFIQDEFLILSVVAAGGLLSTIALVATM